MIVGWRFFSIFMSTSYFHSALNDKGPHSAKPHEKKSRSAVVQSLGYAMGKLSSWVQQATASIRFAGLPPVPFPDVDDAVTGQAPEYSIEEAHRLINAAALKRDLLVKLALRCEQRGSQKYSPEELLNESFYRILTGQRKWPRGLDAYVFITGVIRSIGSEHPDVSTDELDENADYSHDTNRDLGRVDEFDQA